MSIILTPGQRGIMVGQTGSGKTVGAIFQLQHSPQPVVIVFDTKGEPAFNTLAVGAETHEFYHSCDSFISAFKSKDLPNYMIVRPSGDEMSDIEEMDNALKGIERLRKKCLVYIDEAYQWHNNGKAGGGLIGLLTRGRSMGISTLIATQRPSWTSRFCYSESQKFYLYKLSDVRDMKVMAEHIPNLNVKDTASKHHFWYYDNAQDLDYPVYYNPVPLPKRNLQIKESGKKWI